MNQSSVFNQLIGRRADALARWRATALFVVAVCCALAAGCGPGAAPKVPQPAGKAVPVTIGDAPVMGGFEAVGIDRSETSMTLHLAWKGPLTDANEIESIGVCLPAEIVPRASWVEAKLDGAALPVASPVSGTIAAPVRPGGQVEIPRDAGRMEFLGYLRHWPIWRLEVARGIFDPMRRKTDAKTGVAPALTATLEVSWTTTATLPAATFKNPAAAAESAGWRRVAESVALNKEDFDRFYVADPPWPADLPKDNTDPRRMAPSATMWARMLVSQEGLVRVDPRELERLGFASGAIKSDAIRVFSHGAAVPLLIAPGDGAPAGVPAGAYFWAHGATGPYTRDRAYWATLAPDVAPARLTAVSGAPDPATAQPQATAMRTLTRDIDTTLTTRHAQFMAFMGARWVERDLETSRPLGISLRLPDLAPGTIAPAGSGVKTTFHFFVSSERTMQGVEVSLAADGKEFDRLRFTSDDDTTRQATIPLADFHDGATSLTISLADPNPPPPDEDAAPGAAGASSIWFDRLEATYPALPRLEEGRLTIPAETAAGGAAWVGVPDLDAAGGAGIVALDVDRNGEAKGLWPIGQAADGKKGVALAAGSANRVELVDLRKPVDAPRMDRVEFEELVAPKEPCDLLIITNGAFRPMADKLADYRRSQGLHVLVANVQSVYDAFSDGEFSPIAIRRLLAYALRYWKAGAPGETLLVGDTTADYLGEIKNNVKNWVPSYTYTEGADSFASDYWFTTVAGGDKLGDYMIGRLSVSNADDATTVVQKIIDYGEHPKPGPWRARLGFVADEGDFPAVLDSLRREATPAAYEADRVFLDEYPLEDNWYLSQKLVQSRGMKVSTRATEDILRTFRRGVSFLSYYGHGSPNIWSNERMWFGGGSVNSDNLLLKGSGFESFVANMTCNSGAIDYPEAPWNICITEDMLRVPNGGAIACYVPSGPGTTPVHRRMSETLHYALFDRGLRGLGEATTAAKARYLLKGYPPEMAFMYLLLGDPNTQLQMTTRRGTFKPDPASAAPGQTIAMVLTGIDPKAGQWTAELADAQEHRLWSGKGEQFSDGKIALNVSLPTTATTGEAVLRVYCWSGAEGSPDSDIALAGHLKIETPYVALDPIAAAPDGPGKFKAVATVSNPTLAAGKGKLKVWLEDAKSSRTLLEESISGAQRREIAVDAAGTTGGLVLAASVESDQAPDDPSLPQTSVLRIALAPAAADRAVWLGTMCELTEDPRIRLGDLKIAAAIGENLAKELATNGNRLTARVIGVDGRSLIEQPLAMKPFFADGAKGNDAPTSGGPRLAVATLKLPMPQAEANLTSITLWLERSAGDGTGVVRLAGLPLSRIARRSSDVAIVPGSIAHRPEHPSEGETVWIDCVAVNRGNAASPASSMRLLDSPASEGAHAAEVRMGGGTARVPMLAPGRQARIALRWDPVGNAGPHKLWLDLMNESGYTAPAATRELPETTVVALTKPEIGIKSTRIVSDDRDKRLHRIHILVEIENTGQSEARKLLVTFYRSRIRTAATRLQEDLVESLPGGASKTVEYVWTYDPRRDIVAGGTLPQPSVSLQLKGSVRPAIDDSPLPPEN